MQRWEYHVVEGDPLHHRVGPQFTEDLQTLGRQGWEAVGMSSTSSAGGRVQILLKRELVADVGA